MIVVIQCAGSKAVEAGTFPAEDGQAVRFVAHPEFVADADAVYARPDDQAGEGKTWRQMLLGYNELHGDNPLGFVPAARLYTPPVYHALADAFPADKLYILSAGWGLLRSDFLTPAYDITFSGHAHRSKRRRRTDRFDDFAMLPHDITEPVLFLGGKDYLSLFLSLTDGLAAPRIVFYRSDGRPDVPGCVPVRYETPRRTNWHYECAERLLAGELELPSV